MKKTDKERRQELLIVKLCEINFRPFRGTTSIIFSSTKRIFFYSSCFSKFFFLHFSKSAVIFSFLSYWHLIWNVLKLRRRHSRRYHLAPFSEFHPSVRFLFLAEQIQINFLAKFSFFHVILGQGNNLFALITRPIDDLNSSLPAKSDKADTQPRSACSALSAPPKRMIRENKSWSAEGVRRVTLAVDSACADLLSLSPSLSTPNFIRLSVFVIVAFPFPSFLIFEKKIPRVFPTIHRFSFLADVFPVYFYAAFVFFRLFFSPFSILPTFVSFPATILCPSSSSPSFIELGTRRRQWKRSTYASTLCTRVQLSGTFDLSIVNDPLILSKYLCVYWFYEIDRVRSLDRWFEWWKVSCVIIWICISRQFCFVFRRWINIVMSLEWRFEASVF